MYLLSLYSFTSHKDRTFISHPRTRKMLAEYANRKKKHEGPFFKELCLLIEHNKPVLSMLMNHLEMIGLSLKKNKLFFINFH